MVRQESTFDPYDPSRKNGWDDLPDGLACKNCTLFNGIVSRPGRKSIMVRCESSRALVNTTVVSDASAPRGGGWVSDGKCMSGKLAE